jgi:nucleotide-binding universal stress UspA family protein
VHHDGSCTALLVTYASLMLLLTCANPQVVDEAALGAFAGVQQKDVDDQAAAAVQVAEGVCSNALELLQELGARPEQLHHKVLLPGGGASDVGAALVRYCAETDITMCIVGSHGHGAVTKSLRNLVGLGSVSDYCVQNMSCAVCVVRPQQLAAGLHLQHSAPAAQPDPPISLINP